MKKLLLLLFIPLFGCSQKTINKPAVLSHPQTNMMKIGNLEVGDSLALEYLSDCYVNPNHHLIFLLADGKRINPCLPTDDSIIAISISHTIEHGTSSDGTKFTYIYYYTVRTPSDVDFVKWIHSLKK